MDVALVSMPWAIFNRPSIQLGSLQAFLRQQIQDVRVQSLHPYLQVAATVGLQTYQKIAAAPWAAEALYCGLLFPEQKKNAANVFQREMAGIATRSYGDLLLVLEQQMDDWLADHSFTPASVIGFSVCFSQLPASLYAARQIKRHYPEVTIVFGGSTCTPSLATSLLKIYSFLDYIITGEGEQALTDLIRHLQEQRPLQNQGILTRQTAIKTTSPPVAREIKNLADLPPPDYNDYFNQLNVLGLDFNPVLPLEFSRGCWWNKCSFCNLNLQWKGYRFKKSKQVLDELGTMLHTHKCLDFTFTDNALPVQEAGVFFAATAKSGLGLRFFGEIRTLKKPATYQHYSDGGLRSVQIGIEALSDSLLERMHKGTTVMDNLAAMKFSLQAGMALDGNLIVEFPGSTKQEVQETLQLIDFVMPFRPLTAAGFFLGQGSPVCNNPRQFGITHLVQHPMNRQLYPGRILADMNMLISSYRGDRTLQKKRWQPVRKKIRQWQAFHKQRRQVTIPALSYRRGNNFLLIRQEVPGQQPLHHRLSGLSCQIYLACKEPVLKKTLLETFNQVTENQLGTFLDDLEKKHILYSNATSCLALAIELT